MTLGLAMPAGVSANWNEPVPTPLAADAFFPSIVAVGGVPYFAWSDGNPLFQAHVKQLVGGAWTAAGDVLNVDRTKSAEIPNIADVGGVPYVVWSEGSGASGHIYVRRFVGGVWELVGTPLDIAGHTGAFAPSITSVGGVPYVAWRQIEASVSKLYVKRFVAGAWTLVGAALNVGAKDAKFPRIADVGGIPTVAWLQTTMSISDVQLLRVKQFNGTAWVEPVTGSGGVLNVDPTVSADSPSITGVSGVPYVAWEEPSAAGRAVYVKRFTAGAWTLVGDPINIGPGANDPSITSVNGTPFVAWRETFTATNGLVHVKQFVAGAWTTVGGVLNVDPSRYAYQPTITSIGGVPYVAWNEFTSATSTAARVKRLEPDIVSESATPSQTGATLSAHVNDFGVRLPVGFELGGTSTFGTQFGLQTTPGSGTSTLTQTVGSLTPRTPYVYRAFGSDTFRQTSLGATQTFTTTLRPLLSHVAQSARSWRRGSRLPRASRRRAAVGTTFRFRLNEPARVRFDFSRRAVGRRLAGKCLAPTAKNHGRPRCTRAVSAGALSIAGHTGLNKLRFQGRLSRGRQLRPRRYTVILTATAFGLRSRPRSLSFTILLH